MRKQVVKPKQRERRTAFELDPELPDKLAQLAEDVDRRVHPRTALRLAVVAKAAGLDRKTIDNIRYNRHTGPPDPETLVRLYRDGFGVNAKEGTRLLSLFGYVPELWDDVVGLAPRSQGVDDQDSATTKEVADLVAQLLRTQEQLRQARAEIRRLRRR